MEPQEYTPSPASKNLFVVESRRIMCCTLDDLQSWLVGRRDPTREEPDLPLTSRIASREHGWFRKQDGLWFFTENPKNKNGTFYNGRKIKKSTRGIKRPILLSPGDILRIDNDQMNHSDSVMMLFTTDAFSENWKSYSLSDRQTIIIGSDESCDIPQPNTLLSGRHAKITSLNGEYYLSDCGSDTGTYRNGSLVTGTVILREKDYIRLGSRNYFFVHDNLIYCE